VDARLTPPSRAALSSSSTPASFELRLCTLRRDLSILEVGHRS
jgi:hypothetical protein